MAKTTPKAGSGRFQWNAGAWFGSLFGSPAWLLAGTFEFASESIPLAAVWLGCYVAAIAIGTYLWSCRATLAPYPAIQALLFIIGVSVSVAMVSAFFMRPDLLEQITWAPPWHSFIMLSVFPAVMRFLHFQEAIDQPQAAPEP